MYFHIIFGSSFFSAFIRAILGHFVRAAIFIMLLPSCFAALNLSIYLPICLYKVICPSFLKAVLSAKTVPFIENVYHEIQIQKKALYKLYWVE